MHLKCFFETAYDDHVNSPASHWTFIVEPMATSQMQFHGSWANWWTNPSKQLLNYPAFELDSASSNYIFKKVRGNNKNPFQTTFIIFWIMCHQLCRWNSTHWCDRAVWKRSESHMRLLSGCLHLLTASLARYSSLSACVHEHSQNIPFSIFIFI